MIRRVLVIAVLLGLGGCSMFRSSADNAPVYIVFFHYSNAGLSPDAKHIVAAAAAAVRDTKPAQVALAGYTAATAMPASRPLADARFDAVAQELIADGVDSRLLVRVPLKDTEASLGSTADRRVEIRLLNKTMP